MPEDKNCLVCNYPIKEIYQNYSSGKIGYECPRCGNVQLTQEAYSDFTYADFSDEEKNIISHYCPE